MPGSDEKGLVPEPRTHWTAPLRWLLQPQPRQWQHQRGYRRKGKRRVWRIRSSPGEESTGRSTQAPLALIYLSHHSGRGLGKLPGPLIPS